MSLDVYAASLAGRVLAPTGSNIIIAEWTAEAAAGPEPLYQAPLHKHEDDEAWYVLEGIVRIRVGDDEVQIPAGGAAVVPGGTAHTYWNPGSEPARYLLVMGARTYGLIQAIHSPDRGDLRELFTKYGAELLEGRQRPAEHVETTGSISASSMVHGCEGQALQTSCQCSSALAAHM